MRFLMLHHSSADDDGRKLATSMPLFSWIKRQERIGPGAWVVEAWPDVTNFSDVFKLLWNDELDRNVTLHDMFGHCLPLWDEYGITTKKASKATGDKAAGSDPDEIGGGEWGAYRGPRFPLLPDSAEPVLDGMIGIDSHKEKLFATLTGIQYRRAGRNAGLNLDSGFQNLLLLGPSGVGKTTMAKIAAFKLRASLPYAANAVIRLVKASDLVGVYRGDNANNVRRLVEGTRQGIIILDEIDTLLGDGHNRHGEDALDALNTDMGLFPNAPIVIATAYPSGGEAMLRTNIGLSSRFPNIVHMSAYDDETLRAIFVKRLETAKYVFDSKVVHAVVQLLGQVRKRKANHFGNAREVENIFHATIDNVGARICEMGLDVNLLARDRLPDGRGEIIRDLLRTIYPHDVPMLDANGNYVRSAELAEAKSLPEEEKILPFARKKK